MAPTIDAITESYFSSFKRKDGGSVTSQPTQMSPRLERITPSLPLSIGKQSRMFIVSIPCCGLI